jgi:ubiquinone/menaquinone biosynthesis C-methylase UbiE
MTVEPKTAQQADTMRDDWNERARQDAFLYIASWRKDWDEASFFASGEEDYLKLVAPVLLRMQFDPSDKSIAELGCGAGRMTRSFAQHFHSVSAVDISEEMQSRAKVFLNEFKNIRWVLTDGKSLANLESGSVDFVFSYLVLQHFPSRELVSSTIHEMFRILRPGGAFLFQFNGSEQPTMNWKGRMISTFLDNLAVLGLKSFSQSLAKLAQIDPQMIGNTWRGVALTSPDIDSVVRSAGASTSAFLGENTPLAWCYGAKKSQESA